MLARSENVSIGTTRVQNDAWISALTWHHAPIASPAYMPVAGQREFNLQPGQARSLALALAAAATATHQPAAGHPVAGSAP